MSLVSSCLLLLVDDECDLSIIGHNVIEISGNIISLDWYDCLYDVLLISLSFEFTINQEILSTEDLCAYGI